MNIQVTEFMQSTFLYGEVYAYNQSILYYLIT